VLRIHQLGFAWTDTKESGIEILHSIDDSARRHIGRIQMIGSSDRWVELIAAKHGDRIPSRTQVVPELLDVACAGKASGHGDDGDRIVRWCRFGSQSSGHCRTMRERQPLRLDGIASILGQRSSKGRRSRIRKDQRCWDRGWNRACPSLRHPRQQAHRQHRVAAHLEEVVVPTDALYAQRRCEGLA
jgi:hypothetical protein